MTLALFPALNLVDSDFFSLFSDVSNFSVLEDDSIILEFEDLVSFTSAESSGSFARIFFVWFPLLCCLSLAFRTGIDSDESSPSSGAIFFCLRGRYTEN